MADKRLKAMLRSTEIQDVLGNYGFKSNDVLPGVALAAAAVLADSNGMIRCVSPNGKPALARLQQLRPDIFTTTQLRAVPTLGTQLGTRIGVDSGGSGETRFYTLTAGTNNSGDVFVRPDDYDAGSNQVYWKLDALEVNTLQAAGGINAGYSYFGSGIQVSGGYMSGTFYGGPAIWNPYLNSVTAITMNSGGYVDFSGLGIGGTFTLPYNVSGTSLKSYGATIYNGDIYVDASGFLKRY